MILTVCPNPCIDYTMELKTLNVGKLNRISGKTVTYAGKANNVAIVMKRLKGESYATGFMFNENGRLFEERLDKEGVPNTFIWNKGSVRTNYKIIDQKSMMTEINDKGEPVSEDKQSELITLVAGLAKKCSFVVMSGSLPSGVNNDFYLKLSQVLPESVKRVYDTDSENMLPALALGAELVKPNKYELETYIGKELNTKADILGAAGTLLDKGAKNVLISLGSDGAIITNGFKSYFCKSIQVAVNSTVGAGDSMVAAAVLEMQKGSGIRDILKSGVAAGTAAVTKAGTLCTKDKFEEVLKDLTVEEI